MALLPLAQRLAGTLIAHYRADQSCFHGLDLSGFLLSNITCTWHLQTALFWIATACVPRALFLAPAIRGKDHHKLTSWVNILSGALLLVVGGSRLGEFLVINQLSWHFCWWYGGV